MFLRGIWILRPHFQFNFLVNPLCYKDYIPLTSFRRVFHPISYLPLERYGWGYGYFSRYTLIFTNFKLTNYVNIQITYQVYHKYWGSESKWSCSNTMQTYLDCKLNVWEYSPLGQEKIPNLFFYVQIYPLYLNTPS